ncbi:heat shock beta-1 isoform X2 [Brachionus plicatilis]|uniref:Heat shock beta-1 isoform X2 n=1 Tax=Brachionus plicatilis TaxID=10195 RepID=A0A3M7PAM4_BRAPC|nr:heat shock beta-1 isoform X2 [Brachionus plicatilis]
MDNRRVPISVKVNPSEYSGRSIRLGNTDIREKMQQRMREFEDESRRWRDQFMSQSPMSVSGGSLLDRPRMFLNPEFPELQSNFSNLGSRFNNGFFPAHSISPLSQTAQKSFIEEDDNANKRYKITFDVGDFKPDEIQVKTEGRLLVVKGDREIVAGSSSESKQFNREITLPDFVEPTTVTSFLSDGTLTIDAPVQMEKLGYSAPNAITGSSNSNFKPSPARETQSPSRAVHAVREESDNRGAGKTYREFKREIGLPFGADVKRLKNSLQSDGTLLIEIPVHGNDNLKPPLSPLDLDKQFNKFSLNEESVNKAYQNASSSQNTGIVETSQDGKDLKLTFDLTGYKPDDLSIKVIDGNTLRVHAVHIDNTKGNQIHREYTR